MSAGRRREADCRMNQKFAPVCCLLAVCLGLIFSSSTPAASLQLVPNWGASGVPTNLSMYIYVPDKLATNPPILVLLHYWGGGAAVAANREQRVAGDGGFDKSGYVLSPAEMSLRPD